MWPCCVERYSAQALITEVHRGDRLPPTDYHLTEYCSALTTGGGGPTAKKTLHRVMHQECHMALTEK